MMGDNMPSQDVNAITQKIIGRVYDVSNTLGIGFVEKVYENALAHTLHKSGMQVTQQYPIKVHYDGIVVGEFFADLLVEERVLVELKAVSMLNNDHLEDSTTIDRSSNYPFYLCSSVVK